MRDTFILRFLLATFGGWVNREQAQVIAFLAEENRVLREQLGEKRVHLNDDQRRRLAAKGKVVGRRMLREVATIVTPDTILRWHRRLIAATDFFTVDVWTARGTVTHYMLSVIHHATRVVEITGITTNPNAEFMAQIARNLTDPVDGFLRGMRYLILDRDSKFTEQFKRILKDAGVKLVTTAYQAPGMNALAERWVLAAKSECLNRMILFGEGHLRRCLRAFVDHYHRDRPHQSLGNAPITPRPDAPPLEGVAVADERLGGLLRSYRRSA